MCVCVLRIYISCVTREVYRYYVYITMFSGCLSGCGSCRGSVRLSGMHIPCYTQAGVVHMECHFDFILYSAFLILTLLCAGGEYCGQTFYCIHVSVPYTAQCSNLEVPYCGLVYSIGYRIV